MSSENQFLDLQGVNLLINKILQRTDDYTDGKTSEVITQYQSIYNFPSIGDKHKIYIDKNTNQTYRWDDENLKYYCISSDIYNIEIISGGNSRGNSL